METGQSDQNGLTIETALQAVIRESKQPYAITYAQAALELGDSKNAVIVEEDGIPGVFVQHEMTGKIMEGTEMRVQILYVLNNLAGWRGERAREIKAYLKKQAKIK